MVNRMIDLVVLVAEMSRREGKSLRELDQALEELGYSSKEIEQAMFWLSSQNRSTIPGAARIAKPSHRVLSPWESACLDTEAYGYLLHLQNLGIIDQEQFEKIVTRILPIGGEKLPLGELKTLAGAVIFNVGAEDYDEETLDVIESFNRVN
jgi:Smg protein